jgi:uncharacterized protein YndB with AHSA1/START domain
MSVIKHEIVIKAKPDEVYHYFTNSTALKDWMCQVATIDPRPGGHLFIGWPGEYYTVGEYLQLEPDKSVSFTWFGRGEPHSTRVDVSLRKIRGGTRVRLTHRGLGKGQKWDSIAEVYKQEWESSFENLTSVLETGADLRITRRPMIGIYLGDFDPEIAKKLGCPVDYGSRVDGVLDGMGAQKAGLKKDDVIVSIDGKEIQAGNTLISILGKLRAGDSVEIVFYRAGERKVARMVLSGRQLPAIPTSNQEFSNRVADQNHQFEAELEKVLSDNSEADCRRKPTPTEWSAFDILAHLIHSEQGWLNYASEIASGFEAAYDDYSGNMQARNDATLEIYPTKADLLKAFKDRNAETVSFIAHLPTDFHSNKGRWWKLVQTASENPLHREGHLEQIRSALKTTQEK